jgi:hypothetical protein
MTQEGRPFLNAIETLLGEGGKNNIYPCIQDLVEHGLDLARFASGESMPQRQDITQYLAAWSRHAGLNEEESSGWLVEYCVALLSSIARRSPAAIRHSTKSNLRYIYKSAVPFLCQCTKNRFHAHCNTGCPVYDDMQAKLLAKASEVPRLMPVARPPAPVIEPYVPVRERYQEQFQAGLRFALDEVQKGTKIRRIVELLNERGFKTKIGRTWQQGVLRTELDRLKNSQVPAPAGGQAVCSPERPGAEQRARSNVSPARPPDYSEGSGLGQPR